MNYSGPTNIFLELFSQYRLLSCSLGILLSPVTTLVILSLHIFHSQPPNLSLSCQPSSSATKRNHPRGPSWSTHYMMLVFPGAAGQMNWLELEPFSLSCLFVYDKLSEDVWKVNVWIAYPYLIDLLHSPALLDQRGAAGWLTTGGDVESTQEGTAVSSASWLFPDILAEAGCLGRN